jgi:gamma-glutamylcyclotransferase (GGCT)/AIG2-like uncharacterized protein YtfP
MSEKYPFFVYGTLILGQPNDFYWEDCIETALEAAFPNGRLFDMGTFPMLLEGDGGLVKGQIMIPFSDLNDQTYQLLVQRLDTLENYNPDDVANSPYYRVLRQVFLPDNQPLMAWVYLGRPTYTKGRSLISDGDWVNHSHSTQSHMLDWWAKHGYELFDGELVIDTDGKD